MEENIKLDKPIIQDFLNLKEKAIEYDFSNDGANDIYCNLDDNHDMEKFFTYMMIRRKNGFVDKDDQPLEQDGNQKCKEFFEKASSVVAEKIGNYGIVNDPDSDSRLLQEIYKILWNVKEPPINMKNCIKIQGETLNSVNTTLNELYKSIEKEYEKEKMERESMTNKGKNGEDISQGVSIKFILSKYLIEYRYQNDKTEESEIIKRILENKELIAFVKSYHTIGNFMPVPNGCNGPRGGAEVKDYWDLTLYHIYNYYTKGDYKAIGKIISKSKLKNLEEAKDYHEWLNMLRVEDAENAHNVEVYKEWLDSFCENEDGWYNFVRKNYLESFVNTERYDYFPKELWDGHFNGKVLPEGKQFIEYFLNAQTCILERGKRMVKELRNRMNQPSFHQNYK